MVCLINVPFFEVLRSIILRLVGSINSLVGLGEKLQLSGKNFADSVGEKQKVAKRGNGVGDRILKQEERKEQSVKDSLTSRLFSSDLYVYL